MLLSNSKLPVVAFVGPYDVRISAPMFDTETLRSHGLHHHSTLANSVEFFFSTLVSDSIAAFTYYR